MSSATINDIFFPWKRYTSPTLDDHTSVLIRIGFNSLNIPQILIFRKNTAMHTPTATLRDSIHSMLFRLPCIYDSSVPVSFMAGITVINQLGKVGKGLVPVTRPCGIRNIIGLYVHGLAKLQKLVPDRLSKNGAHLFL